MKSGIALKVFNDDRSVSFVLFFSQKYDKIILAGDNVTFIYRTSTPKQEESPDDWCFSN